MRIFNGRERYWAGKRDTRAVERDTRAAERDTGAAERGRDEEKLSFSWPGLARWLAKAAGLQQRRPTLRRR